MEFGTFVKKAACISLKKPLVMSHKKIMTVYGFYIYIQKRKKETQNTVKEKNVAVFIHL